MESWTFTMLVDFAQRCEIAIKEGTLAPLQFELRQLLKEYTSFSLDGQHFLNLKIKALVLDLLHAIDVLDQLLRESALSIDDWTWMRQLRFYASSEDGSVTVQMAQAQFNYSYEYQGNAPKLVYTPLTEKCFLTLTQGMRLGYGGNPYGPAGTGKTESVKALGQLLGRQVLVFNCDGEFDFRSMGRIFTGLIKCGAWGCFDEFNRLEEDVLSAVSQQIQVIQSHCMSGKDKGATAYFDILFESIREVGEKSVVGVIMDNAAVCVRAGRLVEDTFPMIFHVLCVAHCFDLVLHDVGKMEWVARTVGKANDLVKFINNHQRVRDVYCIHSGGRQLLRPATTRFATNFHMFDRLRKQRKALVAMVTTDERWTTTLVPHAQRSTFHEMEDVLLDAAGFWKNVNKAINAVYDIVLLLKVVDGNGPTISRVYAKMDRIVERLRVNKDLTAEDREEIEVMVMRRWNAMTTPLHCAALFLDPEYRTSEPHNDPEIQDGFYTWVYTWLKGSPQEVCDEVEYEVDCWVQNIGKFISQATMDAARCERNWSLFAAIHSKERNALAPETVHKLVYTKWNMRVLDSLQRMPERAKDLVEWDDPPTEEKQKEAKERVKLAERRLKSLTSVGDDVVPPVDGGGDEDGDEAAVPCREECNLEEIEEGHCGDWRGLTKAGNFLVKRSQTEVQRRARTLGTEEHMRAHRKGGGDTLPHGAATTAPQKETGTSSAQSDPPRQKKGRGRPRKTPATDVGSDAVTAKGENNPAQTLEENPAQTLEKNGGEGSKDEGGKDKGVTRKRPHDDEEECSSDYTSGDDERRYPRTHKQQRSTSATSCRQRNGGEEVDDDVLFITITAIMQWMLQAAAPMPIFNVDLQRCLVLLAGCVCHGMVVNWLAMRNMERVMDNGRRIWVLERSGGVKKDLQCVGHHHDKVFIRFCRLPRPLFHEVLQYIGQLIQRQTTNWRQPLSAEHKFACALIRWATGGYYRQSGHGLGMGLMSVLRSNKDVAETIIREYPHVISFPQGRRLEDCMNHFERKGFPGCVGAIDCTHLYIEKPRNKRSECYFDRTKQLSVVAQVVATMSAEFLIFMSGARDLSTTLACCECPVFAFKVRAVKDFVAPQVLWIGDLVMGDKVWLARFNPPSRPTQALIAYAQKQVIVEVRERSISPEIHSLPLIDFLSFNDWAELIYVYRHKRSDFIDTLNRMMRATTTVKDAVRVEERTIEANTIEAKSKLIKLWSVDSQFHREKDVRKLAVADEVAIEDEEDELTEEEKEYLKKKDAEMAKTKACLMTSKKKTFSDVRRNPFLPLASPRWVEIMSTAFSSKIWSLETFNFLAPIDQRGYRLLVSLTQDEMKKRRMIEH
ncbi:hypothetical protein CBR_g38132 [Chara braunii]|uniref:Dynein heavy chain, cytoplasmic n=1 Tax=Chara braunii TaxID=69332 RepID=A0A388LPA3_CHABU|nr:hypothetical protein CBR_g38132 [Chara braunii]|eukprot:GBG84158.1 hypothetical protein CBR_g38132 [Chara braunii]